MESNINISNETYDIPAVINVPETNAGVFPAVILCHGTASQKNEVGDLFVKFGDELAGAGIASIRFDFAGCGDSRAEQTDLTFYGEVSDTEKVYEYLVDHESIDSDRIGILGFSQGARVMAEFLGDHTDSIKAAVSLSGACHNGKGVFRGWFERYEDELEKKGYATIPMGWREDLILPAKWFDDVKKSNPMDELSKYEGSILAVSGTDDELVPYRHVHEIIDMCSKAEIRDLKIIKDADHIFNCLDAERSKAEYVLDSVSSWINRHI
ncbi:MAG TPA: alpha/beta hydrolase [Candidatus Salinicoccus stercoripullorum]|uniref:Alpha/beta hydrolase n=1 Tax=Candidatus Salinicoccus stercoripullorum TaxID=2838756 RepID=A0A9D1TZS9_9STAP|nr:alpha/beta hydrolase [Candidatus Salinicoccus stercoripullorum]